MPSDKEMIKQVEKRRDEIMSSKELENLVTFYATIEMVRFEFPYELRAEKKILIEEAVRIAQQMGLSIHSKEELDIGALNRVFWSLWSMTNDCSKFLPL